VQSTLPDSLASVSTWPVAPLADKKATGETAYQQGRLGGIIDFFVEWLVDALSDEGAGTPGEEDLHAISWDSFVALFQARSVDWAAQTSTHGYWGRTSTVAKTWSDDARFLAVIPSGVWLQGSADTVTPLFWAKGLQSNENETAVRLSHGMLTTGRAIATGQPPAAYPQLKRAIAEGRITGRGLPKPGLRSLRVVSEPEAHDEDFQVAFGRAGDPPSDFVRRSRRS
jgi:hypothetical protein